MFSLKRSELGVVRSTSVVESERQIGELLNQNHERTSDIEALLAIVVDLVVQMNRAEIGHVKCEYDSRFE